MYSSNHKYESVPAVTDILGNVSTETGKFIYIVCTQRLNYEKMEMFDYRIQTSTCLGMQK